MNVRDNNDAHTGHLCFFDRTYAMEGCGEAQPPRIPLFPPAAARQPGATPTALPPRAGNNRLVEGRRPSTPPRRKATAYVL
jgi:hypothetical protein